MSKEIIIDKEKAGYQKDLLNKLLYLNQEMKWQHMLPHQINYHIMGYYPISPSTEVAQFLDGMKTRGQHDIKLIAADGEHGSAGICYGAAATGADVYLMQQVQMVSYLCLNNYRFNLEHVCQWY